MACGSSGGSANSPLAIGGGEFVRGLVVRFGGWVVWCSGTVSLRLSSDKGSSLVQNWGEEGSIATPVCPIVCVPGNLRAGVLVRSTDVHALLAEAKQGVNARHRSGNILEWVDRSSGTG